MSDGTVTLPIREYNIMRDKARLVNEDAEYFVVEEIAKCEKNTYFLSVEHSYYAVDKDKVISGLKSQYEKKFKEMREQIAQLKKKKPVVWYKRLFQ